jgi:hypothetical protein
LPNKIHFLKFDWQEQNLFGMNKLIKNIGYYKYYPTNPNIADCIREYPITEEILKYIKTTGLFKLEYQNSKPKLIKGKFVVLI